MAESHERAWDFIIEENIRALRQRSGLTFLQVTQRLEHQTREPWSVSRTQDLFGAHQLREYKWREVVALTDVFGVGILDVVLPDEACHPAPFKYLADSFAFPANLLTKESRDRARRSQAEDWLVEMAILHHPEYTELGKAKTRMDELNAELRELGPQHLGRLRTNFESQAEAYERESDRLRNLIKRGAIPNPTQSATFQRLVDKHVAGADAADLVGEELSDGVEALWEELWRVVWDEADIVYRKKGADVS